MSKKDPAEKMVRDIRRKTRRHRSSEEKISVALSGLRGEESIAAQCRQKVSPPVLQLIEGIPGSE